MQRLNCSLKELKFAPGGTDAEQMTFSGYGAVFGNVDAYGDVILPGAFAQSLTDARSGKAAWPVMLLQHGGLGLGAQDLTPIGIWTDIAEDEVGLRVTGRLAETPRGREVHSLMRMEPRPAIDGLSIGYVAREWESGGKPGEPRRRLKRIELIEISPVTFPANARARVDQVKSVPDIRLAERALREAGFSRTQAKAVLAEGFSALPLRDAEDAHNGGADAVAALLRRNIATIKTSARR